MAIDDKILQSFFKRQKKAPTDALVCTQKSNKGVLEKTYEEHSTVSKSLANRDHTVSKPPVFKNFKNQTVSKALAEPLANREQIVSLTLANHEQNVSKSSSFKSFKNEAVSKALAEPLAEPLAKREQTVSKALASEDLNNLVGNEKKLLSYVFNNCQINGSLETSIITTEEIKNAFGISSEHIRNLIFRLSGKGFIEVSSIKNGRYGWRKFKLSKEVFQKLSLYSVSNTLATREQTVSKALAEPLAEPLANVSCSSSLKDLNKTTTTQEGEGSFVLPPEWEDIDFSELHKRKVYFGIPQIVANWKFLKNHSALEFQMSIEEFVHDLDAGHVYARKGNMALFMGIIQKGNLYVSSHYVSPAREKMNAVIAAAEKRKEEALLYKQSLEDNEFHQWLEKQDLKNIRDQLPVSLWVPFEFKDPEAYDWLKYNVYLPQKNASASETENN